MRNQGTLLNCCHGLQSLRLSWLYWSSALPYTDKYSEVRVTSLERCPTESVNSIAGSDEVLYRPIGKAYRGDLVAFGAGNIRHIVVGRDEDFVRRWRYVDRAGDLQRLQVDNCHLRSTLHRHQDPPSIACSGGAISGS